MDSLVFAAVLFAAAAHAGWNATIKRGLDPLLTTVLIAVGAGGVALPMLPFLGPPAAPRPPLGGRLGAHPSRLFRRPDRGLPDRRHEPGLSDRARDRAVAHRHHQHDLAR